MAPGEIRPKGTICLACQDERARKRRKRFYMENRERLNANSRAYHAANREANKERFKKWYEENREEHKANVAGWKELNREKQLEYCRKHRRLLRADPERWAEYLENKRIDSKLRRERKGIETKVLSQEQWEKNHGYNRNTKEAVRVATEPLLHHIQKWRMSDPDNTDNLLAEAAGVSERRIGAIIRREQDHINLSTADKLCTALGMPFELVYDDEGLIAA